MMFVAPVARRSALSKTIDLTIAAPQAGALVRRGQQSRRLHCLAQSPAARGAQTGSWPLLRPGVAGLVVPRYIHTRSACSAGQGSEDGPTTNAQDQRDAATLRKQASEASDTGPEASAQMLSDLPAVVIDTGIFKYVLMKVTASSGESRYLVRGTAGAAYHKDVALPYVRRYIADGFGVEILGGGRIFHDAEKKSIRIYGFSFGFPWAPGAGHHLSAAVVRASFPGYAVEWCDEGY